MWTLKLLGLARYLYTFLPLAESNYSLTMQTHLLNPLVSYQMINCFRHYDSYYIFMPTGTWILYILLEVMVLERRKEFDKKTVIDV